MNKYFFKMRWMKQYIALKYKGQIVIYSVKNIEENEDLGDIGLILIEQIDLRVDVGLHAFNDCIK